MLGLFRLSSDELGHAGNGEGNDPVVGGVHETLVDKIGSDRAKGAYSGVSNPDFFRWLNQSPEVPCGSVSERITGPCPACSAAVAR